VSRVTAMAQRLPPVYDTSPDTLLAQLLSALALPVEVLDEERLRVQRSHWIDAAVERADVEKLGALLDRRLEPWQPTELFRDHLKALARARLAGGVARGPIERFVGDILRAAVQRLGLRIDAGAPGGAQLRENPELTGRLIAGDLTPLDRMEVTNRGLTPAVLQANLVALPGTRAAVPLLAVPPMAVPPMAVPPMAMTDAAAPQQGPRGGAAMLGWAGVIPAGARLRIRAGQGIRAGDEGATGPTVAATLDGEDVSDLLFSVRGYQPGQPLARDDIVQPAEPLLLPPGPTRLWYVTAGLYDRPELDAVMFAVAGGSLRQGRFDQDEFADALFSQPATISAELFWRATAPATFAIEVPAGVMAADPPLWPDRDTARERLQVLLDRGVGELRAAGVRSSVKLVALREVSALTDRAVLHTGLELRDAAPPAPSPAPDFGALLDVTPLDRSRLE